MMMLAATRSLRASLSLGRPSSFHSTLPAGGRPRGVPKKPCMSMPSPSSTWARTPAAARSFEGMPCSHRLFAHPTSGANGGGGRGLGGGRGGAGGGVGAPTMQQQRKPSEPTSCSCPSAAVAGWPSPDVHAKVRPSSRPCSCQCCCSRDQSQSDREPPQNPASRSS